jgi:hypothetical protein
MKSRVSLLAVCLLFAGGCQQHPLTDYRPLVQAGVWSGGIEQLKALNTSDPEVAQIVKLKHAHVPDDTCVALISAAHANQHPFNSADSVISLQGARYADADVLDFARANQLDSISGDAVMLRLIGLSDGTVQAILQRHLKGLPTMGTAEIGRLKNTGLTEKQILERVNEGMTDEQADKEAASREAARNHAHTDFVSIRGRKPQPR